MPPVSTHTSPILRFSIFEVNLQTGELRRKGQKVKLQDQPFQVLAALLERPGEVVTREELRSRLWPADTFVDFDHRLAAAISKLRDALNDSAENPRFVETVGRRGYRFMVPVEPVTAAAEVIQLQRGREPPVAPPAQRKPTLWRPASISIEVALLLVVVFFVLRRWRQSDVP